ncbi:hypothetical protein ACNOYE_06940 [Nannocystaceae bacterium ST9]
MIGPRLASLLLALALPLGCNETRDAASDEGPAGQAGAEDRPPLFNPDPSAPAPRELVPALAGPSVGMQPGYLDGAFLFASVRVGTLQELVHGIPLSPDAARDLAMAGSLLGVDPRVDDVLEFMGLDPQARASFSIRPILDHAGAIQQTLEQAGPLIDELARPDTPDQTQPPPLSTDAELLLDRVETLGLHLRMHLPIADIERSQTLRSMSMKVEPGAWTKTCVSLQPHVLCTGDEGLMLVARMVPGGVQLDALTFFRSAHDEAETELRSAVVQQAVAAPSATAIPDVGSLRGDANLLIASASAFNALRARELGETIANLRWEGRSALERHRERDEALRAIHEPARLFDGVALELDVEPQRMLANFAWLPTKLGEQAAGEMFGLLQVDADVPTLASLCAGSLACGRSRGVPSTARFASLATGPFADPELFETTFEQGEDESMLALLVLESWPNALGMLGKFPGQSLQPPESVVAENSKKAVERVLAFGFALRERSTLQGRPLGEWVGFARMPAMDLSTLRGLMRMAEIGLTPTTIEGVPGSIETAHLPDDEVPARFYAISDPPIETGDWGWAVLADGDESVGWLAGLPRDDGSAPIAYFEVPDLWRAVESVDELAREFGFARAWMTGRSLRAQWDQGKSGPAIRVALEKP